MSTEKPVIRILVADDHPLVRRGLCDVIAMHPDMTVAGETGSIAGILEYLEHDMPDLLLLDMFLPDGIGLDLLERLAASGRLPKTLVISMCPESVYALRALRAGALGYIMKEAPLELLAAALRRVAEGGYFVSPEVGDAVIRHALTPAAPAPAGELDGVSNRELEVLALMGRGLNGRDIAAALAISEKTVSTYKSRLREKLRCTGMDDLQKKALLLTDPIPANGPTGNMPPRS